MRNKTRPRYFAVLVLTAAVTVLSGCAKKDTAVDVGSAETAAEAAAESKTSAENKSTEGDSRETKDGMVRSYLTGEWVSEEIGTLRPLAVMINNVKAAQPCVGLNSAGVIYETPMEGGEVRLEMIIEDYEDLERIGSVRSARTYHPLIASEFDAIFIHYGRSKYVVDDLNSENCDDIDGVTSAGYSAYYRVDDRKAPHNAFTTPAKLDAKIKSLGFEREYSEDYTGNFRFADDDSTVELTDGETAEKVTIGYLVNKPWFTYNEEDQLYYRCQYGGEQIDELDGKQVSCRNILVQYCDYEMQPDNYTNDIYTVGEGKGVYITGGKAVSVTWKKEEKWGNTVYYDEDGEEITLNQGKTWVCLVLDDMTGEITLE